MIHTPHRRHAIALAALACVGTTALGQTPTSSSHHIHLASANERLSDWMARLQASAASGDRNEAIFWPGTQWLRTSRVAPQRQQRDHLLSALAHTGKTPPEALIRHLEAQPVTGREPLPLSHPDLLAVHSDLDPFVATDDRLVLVKRPARVEVWREDGVPCHVPFMAGARARDYLSRCAPTTSSNAVDDVWIVQPEGRVERVGVATWNAATQTLPAPGARLWAPSRTLGWPFSLHQALAQWLATQGPALDSPPSDTPPAPTETASFPPAPADLVRSANDWGMTGLMQTASARLQDAGHVGFTFMRTAPYDRWNGSVSPWDGVEIAVRYTRVDNRLYGPAEFSGDRSYLDKSAELKFRLSRETALWPQLALGLRDPGGTGLFAGEYLVASKRHGPLDFSLGLGWGYAGARGHLPNPLSILGSRFDTRAQSEVGQGGTAHLSSLFTGRTALFGGVQWQTPWAPWLVKVELDGNHYRNEPLDNAMPSSSPLNVAAVWQRGPVELTLGWARGRQIQLGLALHTDLRTVSTEKRDLPARPAVEAWQPAPPVSVTALAPDRQLLADLAEQTGWRIEDVQQQGGRWIVQADDANGTLLRERLDRGNAVLSRYAPSSVSIFTWKMGRQGVPTTEVEIERESWQRRHLRWNPDDDRTRPDAPHASPPGLAPASEWSHPPTGALSSNAAPDLRVQAPPRSPWSGKFRLGYQQSVGGPDGYLYALTGVAQGEVRLASGLWAQGTTKLRLLDNYDQYRNGGSSHLPPVRTQVREYVTSTRVTIPNAQLTHFARWGDNVFTLAYAGWLESMFAGVGGEVMWRAPDSPWAFSADLNRVAQRDFDQRTSVRDYRVTTGHLGLHWTSVEQGLHAQLLAGQYLAGDRGVTVDVARVFRNGTRIGAWITKTNVSAEQYGEGSFDKGLYVSVPFDALFSRWMPGEADATWQPLVRDGGARLRRAHSLWELTRTRGREAMTFESAPPPAVPVGP